MATNRYDKRVLGRNFCVTNDTYVTNLNNNDLIIGGSGSGKTGGVIYPTLKCAQNESYVFVDAKGLMSKMFSEELESKGYDVKIISLIHPERSVGYNPLAYIRVDRNGHVRYQDIVTLANALMPTLDKTEPVWEEHAKIVIQFLIAWCVEKLDKKDWNLKTIVDLYHVLVRKEGIQYFLDMFDGDYSSFAAQKLLELHANKAADRMFASILGFVNVALAPYGYPEIQKLLCNESCVDWRVVGNKKQVVFIQVSDTDRSYDTLVNVMLTQALNTLIDSADSNKDGRLKVPCRLLLDDMGACAAIPDFARMISVIRSRDIYVSVILQSMSQLCAMYNRYDALTIISNCDHVVYLNSNDLDSVEYVCNRANRTKESVLNMQRSKQFVFTTGEKAQLIDKHPAYADVSYD